MKINPADMTPQESRALAAQMAEMPPRQRRVMAYAIQDALREGKTLDTEKVKLPKE